MDDKKRESLEKAGYIILDDSPEKFIEGLDYLDKKDDENNNEKSTQFSSFGKDKEPTNNRFFFG